MTGCWYKTMPAIAHPGRLLRREIEARGLSANRLALDLGVPSGHITGNLHGRGSISADTAVRLGRYFGDSARFWLDLQSQYDIAVVERERGKDIARRAQRAPKQVGRTPTSRELTVKREEIQRIVDEARE